MKRPATLLALPIAAALALTGCGGSTQGGGNSAQQEAKQVPDLAGEWQQTNSNSDDARQVATVKGKTITIYWKVDEDNSKSLYWAGSFKAPTTADEPYEWTSKNDKSKTSGAMMASSDKTKTFTYKDGKISYEASAMGTTMTMELERQ